MKAALTFEKSSPVALQARTAEELMTPNPLSLRDTVTIREAVAFLIDKGVSGAPVIDEAGRPVGVLSQTDILIHDRETMKHVAPPEYDVDIPLSHRWWKEFQIEKVDDTEVRELMTPAVFAVGRNSSARSVVAQMCELNVHRLFVVDGNGVLVGVISALDVLRNLNAAVD